MKQIFIEKGDIVVREVPPPVCGEGVLLVANRYSLISSGTESSVIEESSSSLIKRAKARPDLVRKVIQKVKQEGLRNTIHLVREKEEQQRSKAVGYSSSGIVIEVGGKIADFNVGDRIACAGAGIANHAEVIAVPQNLAVRLPANVEFCEGAFATLGAIAMQGIRRAEARFGETIVVTGLGLLGLIAVQIAKAGGYRVIGIDIDRDRVGLAARVGADLALTLRSDDVEKEVLDFTRGVGADAVVIYAATQSSEPANQAMRMCRKKGRVVVVGSVGMDLKRDYMYEKELDFVMSTSYGPGRYDPLYERKGIDYAIGYVRWTENRNIEEFVRLIAEKKVDVKPLVSLEFSIDDAPKAYEAIRESKPKPLALILKYDTYKFQTESSRLERKVVVSQVKPRDKDVINVAVIGAGGFARAMRLPNIVKISGYNLRAIADIDGNNAKQAARKFRAEYCTTDYKEVLEDKDVDMVIIATRHNLHAPIAIEAARAGKDILLEKPMAMNYEELEELKKVILETGVNLTVGFNRRYSPLSMRAKELLSTKKKPFFINYRVNAGFIPKDNWTHDPAVGGGRIIGECCHFFDLFNCFIDSETIEIDARSIPVNGANVVDNDNIVATVRYQNGSLAVLTYVALGHKSLPKERIEIFADGSSIVIDDFKKLELYGFKEKNVVLRKQDKGHYNELVEFLKKIKGEDSNSLGLAGGIETTICSLETMHNMKKLINKEAI